MILDHRFRFLNLTIFFVLSTTIFTQNTVTEEKSVCIKCHLESGEKSLITPVESFTKKEDGKFIDVHAKVGISCHNCHGGNPTNEDRAKEPSEGYIGKPEPKDIPNLCSKCHSDIEYMKQFNPRLPTNQFQVYQTSTHGKKLKEGDTKVATCTSCHYAHGIRSNKDPVAPTFPNNVPKTCGQCHSNEKYMREYNIPTDQLEKYTKSKHGKMLMEQHDLTAPNCTTCHGSHGATPAGVAFVHEVCGQCHAQQEEYFLKSSHAQAFKEKKQPACVTCHGKHNIPTPTDEMMNNKPGSICMTCHKVDDKCFIAVGKMNDSFDQLNIKLEEAEKLLEKAERLGMGVEKAKFSLNEVKDYLTRARIKIHQFKAETVLEEISKGLQIVQNAHKKAKEALKEWQFRRIGLGISLILIFLTIIALILKIKTLEQ